jgi:hypothetical protein
MKWFDPPVIENQARLDSYITWTKRTYWGIGALAVVLGGVLAYLDDNTLFRMKGIPIYLMGGFFGGLLGASATQLKMAKVYQRLFDWTEVKSS